jgi:hypothetical protein
VHVVNSENELVDALKQKLPFELGPSFTSLKLPLFREMPKDPSAKILATLADNTTITSLTMRNVAIWSKKSMDALEKNLIANQSITKLIFEYFSFEQSTAGLLKIFVKILTKNNRIQDIQFLNNDDRITFTYDLFCENIHKFAVKSISMANLIHFNNSGLFKALPQSPTLTSLKVDFRHQSPEVFGCMSEALIGNPRITSLEIGSPKGTIAGDRWMNFVSVLERDSLKRLHLTNSMKAQDSFDQISEALKKVKALEEFGIENTQISWTSIGAVLAANKSIKKLVLDQSLFAKGRFLELELDKNYTLTELSLIGCKFSGQPLFCDYICKNTTLKILRTEAAYVMLDCSAFILALKTNGSLTELELVRSSVPLRPINDPEPVTNGSEANVSLSEVIADILTVNKSLRKLKFPADKCKYSAVCQLIDSLKQNKTLTELSLGSRLPFIGSQNKQSGAPSIEQQLLDLLKVNTTLKFIEGSADMPELHDTLKRNE